MKNSNPSKRQDSGLFKVNRFFANNHHETEQFKRFLQFCKERELDSLDFENVYYQFGYEVFGVVLYGFSSWLLKELDHSGIRQILFFSRDGLIMKKAFELFEESKNYDSKYIYVSRRSMRVPQLWYKEASRLEVICPTMFISIQDLLESIGLDADKHKETLERHGLEPTTTIRDKDIEKDNRVIHLLDDIWPEVTENSKNEYKNALSYIKSLDIDSNVAVVDIGWRGSMQSFMESIAHKGDIDLKTKGFYITLSSSHLKGVRQKGFLGGVDEKSEGCDHHRGYVGLIETLFMGKEGSVKRYVLSDEGEIVPELYENEYKTKDGFADEVLQISTIQQAALDFIKDYLHSGENFLENFSDLECFTNLHQFGTNPSMKDLLMFRDFRFYNGSISYLARARSKLHYIAHPKDIKTDFYGSRWRIGFLKDLFKIGISYEPMFNLIMEYVKKG